MSRIGNFLFHYRNGLFPLVYALLLIKSPPVLADYRVAVLWGFGVACAGQALRWLTIGLEYIIRGGRKRRIYAEGLVQGGVFAHCRNPLYLGNFLIVVGVGLVSNSALFLGLGVPLLAFAYWAIVLAEEDYLRKKFGGEFTDYSHRVNRFIPDPRGFRRTIRGARFNWRRLVTAEYGSTFIWLGGVILLTLRNVWNAGTHPAQRSIIWSLWVLLAMVTVAYGVARYLKKSGRLSSP